MKLLIIILSVLYATCAYSSVQIVSIHGNKDHISIVRHNKSVMAREFLVLQSDDVIKIEKGNTRVVLDLDGGKKITVSHKNSPYRVPNAGKNNSLIANLAGWVNGLYGDLHEKKPVRAAVMIARGDDNKILLSGMDLRNNIIPKRLEELVFFWSGGQQPYQVTVYTGDDEHIIYQKKVESQEIAIPLKLFTEGEYLFEVQDHADNPLVQDSQYFTIVNNEQISKEIVNLEEKLANENYQIKVAGLATIPEYRFYALQLAKANGDNVLVNALLAQLKPSVK